MAVLIAVADHKRFTLATDIKVYFCDPQNPWQKRQPKDLVNLLRRSVESASQ